MISRARPGKKNVYFWYGKASLIWHCTEEREVSEANSSWLACYLERNLRKHHFEDSVVRGRDGIRRGYLEVLGEPTKIKKILCDKDHKD